MLFMAWPDCTRRSHISSEFLNSPSSFTWGERMFWLPSAWHDWQEFLMLSIQVACKSMPAGMWFGFLSEPGNSLAAGILSIEYQYMPG